MSLLPLILIAALAGGLLSVVLASFALMVNAAWIPAMVSYAIGALLGAAFLDVLPHALARAASAEHLSMAVLGGILMFFLLEKLVLWRHCHAETCEAHGAQEAPHGHDHGRSGLMITIGDTFHNFVDGVMIAAAFLVDVQVGVVTALAIIAHEIPQELGDFLILLHSGYSRARALVLNLVSSAATLVGATLGYFILAPMQAAMPYVLAVAASGMIYVAVADLIPGLHKRAELRHTAQQIALILMGVATVYLGGELAHHWTGLAGIEARVPDAHGHD
jgi:zinc and cadmium transporter